MRENGLQSNAGRLNLISLGKFVKRLEFYAQVNSVARACKRSATSARRVPIGCPLLLAGISAGTHGSRFRQNEGQEALI